MTAGVLPSCPCRHEPWKSAVSVLTPSADHVSYLALHPSTAPLFDDIYGPGAAESFLARGLLYAVRLGPGVVLASPVATPFSAMLNRHVRDGDISFDEESHTYYLHPGTPSCRRFPTSVSGVWSMFFEEFDPDQTLDLYFDRWCVNPNSKYHDTIITMRGAGHSDMAIREHIKDTWKAAGEAASTEGTFMHRQIELALGGDAYDASRPELGQFHDFVRSELEPRGWRAFRTEWSVFDDRVMVAGQIDAIFCDTHGNLHMVDWKRCREPLDPEAKKGFGRYGRPPCNEILDNSCNHYFLQQNLYAAILRRCYGVHLASMTLAQFHPDQSSYRMVKVPFWPVLADLLLERSVSEWFSEARRQCCDLSSQKNAELRLEADLEWRRDVLRSS
eukprot:TRINITY_DN17056_c0_g1_i1.p1 TRINITY_DN17056_c0_g1~~TRINITY_DN17056_c0_g1_i1.p1  ORF type:complete len:388 (-),score=61.34 TRINITY_DN17056_c0_g1_i1:305-1468(-)